MKYKEFIKNVGEVYEDYEPNDKALDAITDDEIVVIAGPSGIGKDTTRRWLWLPKLVCDTIREPRVDNGNTEIHSIDYFFRGKQLGKVWRDVEARNYVQIGMGPSYESFYGSPYKRHHTP